MENLMYMYNTARSAEVEPPRLGSKWGKRVERMSDFYYILYIFQNHSTYLPTYPTCSKCGKWVERFSDFGKYKGNVRNILEFTQPLYPLTPL